MAWLSGPATYQIFLSRTGLALAGKATLAGVLAIGVGKLESRVKLPKIVEGFGGVAGLAYGWEGQGGRLAGTASAWPRSAY